MLHTEATIHPQNDTAPAKWHAVRIRSGGAWHLLVELDGVEVITACGERGYVGRWATRIAMDGRFDCKRCMQARMR